MRPVATMLGIVLFLTGVIALAYSLSYPGQFVLTTASAVQVQQVYAVATYYATLGIGALLASIFLAISVLESSLRTTPAPSPAENLNNPQ